MKNDIKNKLSIYEYPCGNLNVEGKIDSDLIAKSISAHRVTFRKKFNANDNFYVGKNDKTIFLNPLDMETPNNQITVPYARTMTNIIKGYQFKPGLIRYSLSDITLKNLNDKGKTQLYDEIKNINKINHEDIQNAELGEHQSKYGIGFQLLYSGKDFNGMAIPKFVVVNPKEIFPIYNTSIERNLIAAVRYIYIKTIEEYDEKDNPHEVNIYKVDVYYQDYIDHFEFKQSDSLDIESPLTYKGTDENIYSEVPLCIYINNQEYMADYEPVQTLISLYDKLVTDSANELDRFAAAYLVLKNFILAGNKEDQQNALERLKQTRVFEIDSDGEVKFLTKDIPTEFFQELKNTLREDVSYHSNIPDFRDDAFGTASGIAILYKIMNLENLASDKEAYFRVGLEKRNRLIFDFLGKSKKVEGIDLVITFDRNLPSNILEKAELVNKLKASGVKITDETLLSLLPFIEDVEKEIENYDANNEEEFDIEDMDDDEEIKEDE